MSTTVDEARATDQQQTYSIHCKLPAVYSENWQPVAKVGGNQIHSVPMISEVGGDASYGSHRAVAPMAVGEYTVKYSRWRPRWPPRHKSFSFNIATQLVRYRTYISIDCLPSRRSGTDRLRGRSTAGYASSLNSPSVALQICR